MHITGLQVMDAEGAPLQVGGIKESSELKVTQYRSVKDGR
jgi:hypothetical protein